MCYQGSRFPLCVSQFPYLWKRASMLIYAAGSCEAVNAHAIPQLKSARRGIIWVLSIRSLYPLRSGGFLWCSVRSDHHWRAHSCCELDDSWVCIFFGWSVAWILNGCQRDLFSSCSEGQQSRAGRAPSGCLGMLQRGAVEPPAPSPHDFVLEGWGPNKNGSTLRQAEPCSRILPHRQELVGRPGL